MIERLDNALQIAVLLICVAVALYQAIRLRSRTWTLLGFFFGSWVLSDFYWLFCLLFFDQTPQISVVSDLSWYASYLFLYLLLREVAPPVTAREKRFLPWLGFLFAFAMGVFFMQLGQILNNLIYASLMGLLMFSAIRRLMDAGIFGAQRFLCIVILIFCLLEYCLWTASCFWWSNSLASPYFWMDCLLTACFPFFLPATRRAVTE